MSPDNLTSLVQSAYTQTAFVQQREQPRPREEECVAPGGIRYCRGSDVLLWP